MKLTSARIVHRGALINQRGGVSALCFERPRSINMKLASWVMRDEAVTCPKCIARIEAKKADHDAQTIAALRADLNKGSGE